MHCDLDHYSHYKLLTEYLYPAEKKTDLQVQQRHQVEVRRLSALALAFSTSVFCSRIWDEERSSFLADHSFQNRQVWLQLLTVTKAWSHDFLRQENEAFSQSRITPPWDSFNKAAQHHCGTDSCRDDRPVRPMASQSNQRWLLKGITTHEQALQHVS